MTMPTPLLAFPPSSSARIPPTARRNTATRIFAASFLASMALLAQPAQAGEFEGTYQVGPTTCTVTPVKMAYEVRWKKGSGAMMFFFDSQTPNGGSLFVSEKNSAGRNDQFRFDGDSLTTGLFIRADKKTFRVRKISP